MTKTRVWTMKCPKCKGSVFEQFFVTQPDRIRDPTSSFKNSFFYEVSRCVACSWQDAPFEESLAREYASRAFWLASLPSKRKEELVESGDLDVYLMEEIGTPEDSLSPTWPLPPCEICGGRGFVPKETRGGIAKCKECKGTGVQRG